VVLLLTMLPLAPPDAEVEDALAALAHWVPTEKAIQVRIG
jgi:hypothetical protein